MTPKKQQRIAWGLAAWCLVFLAVLAGRPSFTNASLPVRGVADPVVALQMARNADEVEAILGDAPSADREVMRVKQYIDFALIAGYLALALLIAAVLTRARRRRIALLIGCVAVLAALADVLENLATLRVVNLALGQLGPGVLHALRFASVTKWILLAAAMTLLATVTVARSEWYLRTAGLLGLAGAALTAAGLFYNSILVWGGLFMFLGLLLTAGTLKELSTKTNP
ncbi:MAG TPA: hypothetical protein VL127_10900 [Bryobacteraceae bacterium]|nr:hypothetical protein [Bryobacteraceae bacterium]